MSHASRVRGLKLRLHKRELTGHESHASRVRGLKRGIPEPGHGGKLSHASRVRGLKHVYFLLQPGQDLVARFARAWIETK